MTLPNQITDALNHLQDDSGHFLTDAQDTLAELEGHLLAARNRQDLASEKFESLLGRLEQVKTMLREIKKPA